MKNSTLLFLIRKSDGATDICLAMRKQGERKGRYNGIDAVVGDDETPEQAARRSAEEELGVTVESVDKRGEITFVFQEDSTSDRMFHIYVSEDFTGEPVSGDEMSPSWLSTSYIPYGEMWQDVIFWLPHVLEGKKVRGRFVLGEGDVIQEKEVGVVDVL